MSNYYLICKDCKKEIDLDEAYYCNECEGHLCFECYLGGDGLCEECYIDEISDMNI